MLGQTKTESVQLKITYFNSGDYLRNDSGWEEVDGEGDQEEDVEGGGLHGGLEEGVQQQQQQQWQSWRSLDTQHPASSSPTSRNSRSILGN